jgi:tRNA A-37 threonylcarbamoyl transferase component Bud32
MAGSEAGLGVTAASPGGAPYRKAQPRGTTVGRYLILSEIGAGGVGTVYAAHDPELDRKVAIKLMRPETADKLAATEARGRMQREAQAMARLAHPNVVSVYDVGTFGDEVFVAMELIEGQTVKHWCMTKPRTWREIRDAFVQAARGLAAAHAAGLVHRDFKPENVLVASDGRVRVLDFGLARAAAAPTTEIDETLSSRAVADTAVGTSSPLVATLTRTGTLLGTPAYMSPEQHLRQNTDERSDQFSFCVTLYEALYGERPFPGETLAALGVSIMAGRVNDPPKSSAVPSWLRAHVLRGLKPDPKERFPSMAALIDALMADPAARRRRIAIGGAVTIALAAAGAIGYKVSHHDTAQTPAGKPRSSYAPLEMPTNLDFEAGDNNQPKDWFIAGTPNKFVLTRTDEGCLQGQHCAFTRNAGATLEGNDFGTVMQSASARPWRNKLVRFRIHVRVADGAAAFIWLRVDRPGQKMGYFYNWMDRPPITNTEWREVEMVGDIAPDADTINYGVLQKGAGEVWVDQASVEEAPAGTPISQSPIVAVPTNLDFEQGAVGEPPIGWTSLWSPTARVVISAESPHGGGHCLLAEAVGGPVSQDIDAKPWRGKKLHVSGFVRSAGEASLIVVVQGAHSEDQQMFYEEAGIPVAPGTWRRADIKATVGADATIVSIGIYSRGDATKAWLDDVTVTPEP